MGQYTVFLTDDEEKALSFYVNNVQNWLDNIVKSKTENSIDKIFEIFSDKQAEKADRIEKLSIVNNADLDSIKPPPIEGK